jgi:hypothetical protein
VLVKSAVPSKRTGVYFKVESPTHRKTLTFDVLEDRLLTFVNSRIRNGEFTERGLARILGISQPQIHNVLKGARKLRSELADLLLARLGISLLDLLDETELFANRLARNAACLTCPFCPDGLAGTHIPPVVLHSILPLRKPPAPEVPNLDHGRRVG